MALPTDASASGRPPIDFQSLVARCMGDRAFAAKVLALFATDAPTTVRSIEEALACGDRDRAAGGLHRLKGMAANVSMTDLVDVIGELEVMCTSARSEHVARTFERLKAEMDRCLSYIPVVVASH